MALLQAGQLTLADYAKRLGKDGNVDAIAEMLSQQNDILEDIVWREANQPTSELVTIRTGLPTVYWRAYNEGTPSSKSTTAQVTEPCAMMEARSPIDAKLLKLNGNSAAFRLSEDSPFIEAMGQEVTAKIFNGNVGSDMKSFSGLATRYSSTAAGNSQNVLSAGGVGADNASIYLVVWGEQTVYGTFPKGSTAGLSQQDLGELATLDAKGNYYQASTTLFQWDVGLVVKDWRYVVRIANIDLSDLRGVVNTQSLTSPTNIIDLMQNAIDLIPNINMGRAAFYCNRSVKGGIRTQARRGSTNVLEIEKGLNQFGNDTRTLEFQGVPIRTVDKLSTAETLVA